jgi:L-alanine-DL-glutamate epimerase-like enolase superfamily enzyme
MTAHPDIIPDVTQGQEYGAPALVDLALGHWERADFARLIEHGAAAIFNFDVGQVGGIGEAKKIASMAEAHYIQVAPHVYGGPLIAAAALPMSLCSPNFLIMEAVERFGPQPGTIRSY